METRSMSATDGSVKQANQYWAWLLAIIVSIAALIGMLPFIDDFFSARLNLTAVSSYAKDHIQPSFDAPKSDGLISDKLVNDSGTDGFAATAAPVSSSEIVSNNETSVLSLPQVSANISEEETTFSDNSQTRLIPPSSASDILPQRQIIEEKLKQDLKNTIDQLAESKKQRARKPAVVGTESETIKKQKEKLAKRSSSVPSAIAPGKVVGTLRADKSGRLELKRNEAQNSRELNHLIPLDEAPSPQAQPKTPAVMPAESNMPQQELLAETEERVVTSGDDADDNASGKKEAVIELDADLRIAKPDTIGYRSKASAAATSTPIQQSLGQQSLGQQSLVQQFLTEINSLDDIRFQPADGYWANTYVPGDPMMRQLAAGLQGTHLQLLQSIKQNWQPFDPPENSALALYLSVDKAFIDQPTRLRIQLGLKGSLRQGGQRPAMNIAVVLDVRQSSKDFTAIRSLLLALQQAQQPGDRFTLIAAGSSGGLLVEPEQFRFGPLQLALKRLASNTQTSTRQQPMLNLPDAISMAADQVRQADDPNAVLGSSLVLLLTQNSLENDSATLEPIAHNNAIDGIFLSIVSLGSTLNQQSAIQRLVLLGQGNQRRLDHPDQAKALIDRELYATSRAVARAIRLRIRLANGVKLIDVLGSYRLQEPEAQRVREAEQSIDQRMAKNLGIKADRGEDEEGIQIVIPHFYAGDSHIILLDVVAERPGAIAEVTARYKDLVALGNGVAHTQLSVSDVSRAPGPLQRNVLKNLLTFKLTQSSQQASQQLANGNSQQSLQTLLMIRQLFAGMRQSIAAWANDRELLHDERLLDIYLEQLTANSLAPEQGADALRYFAFRKLIPGGESL